MLPLLPFFLSPLLALAHPSPLCTCSPLFSLEHTLHSPVPSLLAILSPLYSLGCCPTVSIPRSSWRDMSKAESITKPTTSIWIVPSATWCFTGNKRENMSPNCAGLTIEYSAKGNFYKLWHKRSVRNSPEMKSPVRRLSSSPLHHH